MTVATETPSEVDAFARPWVAARERARRGERVVASFPLWVPSELIRAAGAVPVALYGAGGELEVTRADARFQSFVCSIAKTTLELGLRGELDGFSGIVFGSICDVARNLWSVFQRNFPALPAHYVHYPQNPTSPSAQEWFEAELARLLRDLSGGRSVSDDALDEAIAIHDRVRAAVRALYRIRTDEPSRLPTFELDRVVRLAAQCPAEEALVLLDEARTRALARKAVPRDAVRVLLCGAFCEQPPIDLVRALEESGLAIVDDDLNVGTRLFGADVGAGPGRPLARIARAFLESSLDTTITRVGKNRPERLVATARALRVDGVVLASAKFCEPALLDQVLLRRALEAAGIPHLRIEFEEKQWTFERLRSEVETFVESLLFD